ncbi:outer membrane immunogenic protein [Devosia lucknowensis]|uniref:Outer membrane immunogenic protein n=1 Tax=Devosia lucknowensis TaxID=1096929 RepID=A0A1Y6F1Z2_9HYPH|nr:outer membrane beta-barrel protein [Devosia lucknowensis]SMQ66802.1 outer membrane immunogenic protein [Devosia lucknowensis]
MRRFCFSTALVLAASPVTAADYSFAPLTPVHEFTEYGYSSSTWSGQYLGASIGGQNNRITVPGNGVLEGFGLIGGFFAGVNYEQDGLVYGVEADVDWNGYDQAAACATPAWYCAVQGSLRSRLGYAVDSFHVYGTAGIAAATVGGYGWTAGLGAEFAFSDELFARAEYRYTALGSANSWHDQTQTGVVSHAFRTGIGYKF